MCIVLAAIPVPQSSVSRFPRALRPPVAPVVCCHGGSLYRLSESLWWRGEGVAALGVTAAAVVSELPHRRDRAERLRHETETERDRLSGRRAEWRQQSTSGLCRCPPSQVHWEGGVELLLRPPTPPRPLPAQRYHPTTPHPDTQTRGSPDPSQMSNYKTRICFARNLERFCVDDKG